MTSGTRRERFVAGTRRMVSSGAPGTVAGGLAEGQPPVVARPGVGVGVGVARLVLFADAPQPASATTATVRAIAQAQRGRVIGDQKSGSAGSPT
jgi:hypothetical protein